jgi:hypothetical protein
MCQGPGLRFHARVGWVPLRQCFNFHFRSWGIHHPGVLANPKLIVILSEAHSGPKIFVGPNSPIHRDRDGFVAKSEHCLEDTRRAHVLTSWGGVRARGRVSLPEYDLHAGGGRVGVQLAHLPITRTDPTTRV